MKRFLSICLMSAMACLAGNAFAAYVGCDDLGTNKDRILIYDDTSDETTTGTNDNDITFGVDFKFPSTYDYDARDYIWVYFLRELSTGDSGNTDYAASDGPSGVLSVIPNSGGTSLTLTLSVDLDGNGYTDLGSSTVTYDNDWHRIEIVVDALNNTSVAVDGTESIAAVAMGGNPGGEYFGVEEFNRVVSDVSVSPYFDNFSLDGVVYADMESGIGSPTASTSWSVKTTDDSDAVPVEMSGFVIE